MNTPLFTGATIVLMTRWNRDVAATLISRYRVAQWRAITTMIIDFISSPNVEAYDLSSLISVGGGGAQLAEGVGAGDVLAAAGVSFLRDGQRVKLLGE